MQQDEIFERLKETLAGALGIEADEIQMESSLVRDLGAESIDFIDILFRLEKTFNIKIPSGELFPGHILNQERFVQGGRVTAEGLEELRKKVPYLDVDAFAKDPAVANLADFFTVRMVMNYLKDRVTNAANA